MELFDQEKPDNDKIENNKTTLMFSSKLKPKNMLLNQILAFFLTAILYSFCHAARTVWGYVKSYLSAYDRYYTPSNMGVLDFTFMVSYSLWLYFNAWVGERINLKILIGVGLSCSAMSLCLFGYLEGFLQINILFVDILTFIINGFGQSTGYPTCVSIVGNWFGNSKKTGLVFGAWGTSLNIGDIIGQQIGRIAINQEGLSWQYALFITCGFLGILLISVLVVVHVHPKKLKVKRTSQVEPLTQREEQPHNSHTHAHNNNHGKAIGFLEAWKIPSVSSYAAGFFCVKGVIYGAMLWLPYYLTNEVGFEGDISFLLASIEIGMIVGSLLLGFLSDRVRSRAVMISFGFFLAVAFLIFTFLSKNIKVKSLYFILLFLSGVGIGAPASLIGGAVSSDLGKKLVESNSANAIPTIAGIMEGSGASGAAITQLFVSNFTGITFPFFAVLCLIGGILMIPVALSDIKKLRRG